MLYLCKYGTLLKTLQETGPCLSCIRYVCVCACALVCVCECLSSFVHRHEKDIRKTTRTLSLASYILYGVKLQPNTHPNETTDSETNRIKRTATKSYFENCVASLSGGKKRNFFTSGCQLTTSQTLKESKKKRTEKTFMDKAAQPCVQTFVSKDTSWKGGKKEEGKKTVYCLDISHIWKYVFPELTFLVIAKRFLFSPFSANEKKNVIHNRYYFSYTKWFSNVKFWEGKKNVLGFYWIWSKMKHYT